MRVTPTAVLAVWIIAGAACDAGHTSETGGTVRDSAGITIVENRDPIWDSTRAWRLADNPQVVVGAADLTPAYELYQANSALRLPDGRLVIANGGTSELRFYDAAGRYITSVGRRGRGPGEFERLQWLARYGADSLLAWDLGIRRLTVLDLDGGVGRTATLEDPLFRAEAVLGDGSLLAAEFWKDRLITNMMSPQPEREGSWRVPIRHVRFATTGEALGQLGTFPDAESWVGQGRRGLTSLPRAFGAVTAMASTSSLLWVSAGEADVLNGYDYDGNLSKQIRNAGRREPVVVTAHDLELWVDGQLDAAVIPASAAEYIRGLLERIPPPDTVPAYDRLLADAEDNLWAERYRRPSEARHAWTVFGPQRRMLGTVEVPGGFWLLEVGPEYVLGRHTDGLGVEQIRLYRLIKP